jgi:hypothetical protein
MVKKINLNFSDFILIGDAFTDVGQSIAIIGDEYENEDSDSFKNREKEKPGYEKRKSLC